MSRRHADIWSHHSHYPVDPYTWNFKVTVKVKLDGQWGLQFILYEYFSFCGNQTIFGWDIANSKFDLIVKVTAQVKSDGHIWGLEFNRYVCFLFRCNQTIFVWDIVNSITDLKNPRSRSWPRPNRMVKFEAKSSIDIFAFCFIAIGPLLVKI